MQNWKKGCVLGHIDKFLKGHDGQIKKNARKNAYLGCIFIPENMWLGCFFLCVHGRACYPLLPFEWPPGLVCIKVVHWVTWNLNFHDFSWQFLYNGTYMLVRGTQTIYSARLGNAAVGNFSAGQCCCGQFLPAISLHRGTQTIHYAQPGNAAAGTAIWEEQEQILLFLKRMYKIWEELFFCLSHL